MEFQTTEFEWPLIRFYEAFSRFVLTTGMVTIAADVDIKYQEHVGSEKRIRVQKQALTHYHWLLDGRWS